MDIHVYWKIRIFWKWPIRDKARRDKTRQDKTRWGDAPTRSYPMGLKQNLPIPAPSGHTILMIFIFKSNKTLVNDSNQFRCWDPALHGAYIMHISVSSMDLTYISTITQDDLSYAHCIDRYNTFHVLQNVSSCKALEGLTYLKWS